MCGTPRLPILCSGMQSQEEPYCLKLYFSLLLRDNILFSLSCWRTWKVKLLLFLFFLPDGICRLFGAENSKSSWRMTLGSTLRILNERHWAREFLPDKDISRLQWSLLQYFPGGLTCSSETGGAMFSWASTREIFTSLLAWGSCGLQGYINPTIWFLADNMARGHKFSYVYIYSFSSQGVKCGLSVTHAQGFLCVLVATLLETPMRLLNWYCFKNWEVIPHLTPLSQLIPTHQS